MFKKMMLFGLLLMVFAGSLHANRVDGESENSRVKESSDVKQDEGIQTGLVIVYGKMIEPPYFITYDEDSLMINDTTIYPRKKDPTKKEVERVISELAKYKHDTRTNLYYDFVNYFNDFGLEEAKNRIKQQYLQDSLITNIDIQFEEKDRRIIIYYNDGNKSNMGFNGYRIRDGKLVELSKPSRIEIHKEKKKQITHALNSNRIFAIGHGYNMHLSDRYITKIYEIIQKINNTEISLNDGEKALARVFDSNKLAKDIVNNLASWRIK